MKGKVAMKTKIIMKSFLTTLLQVINGRFGKRVLKPQPRAVWQFITYGTISLLMFRFILAPLFNWWEGIVHFANFVIWG